VEHARIEAAEGRVLAVSVDHIWAHKAYAASLGGLPFPLLADWSRAVTRQYGVLNEERGAANRSVFLIDRAGIIRYANLHFDVRKREHYNELIPELERLT